jgi:hypothetical protein
MQEQGLQTIHLKKIKRNNKNMKRSFFCICKTSRQVIGNLHSFQIVSSLVLFFLVNHKTAAQQNISPDNIFYAKISIPVIVNYVQTVHDLTGKSGDKNTTIPDKKTDFSVFLPNVKINISNNTFQGKYINPDDNITYVGTFSKDGERLNVLHISLSHAITTPNSSRKIMAEFYLYDLPTRKTGNKYDCSYNSTVSSLYVETYYHYEQEKSSYATTTQEEALIKMDAEKLAWVRFNPRIYVIWAGNNAKPFIAISGNSKILAGFVFAALSKNKDFTLFDYTDWANKARDFEVSLAAICVKEQIPFLNRIAENLAEYQKKKWNPRPCDIEVMITEKDVPEQHTIWVTAQVTRRPGHSGKVLNYKLYYDVGNTDSAISDCYTQLIIITDKIVALINEFIALK